MNQETNGAPIRLNLAAIEAQLTTKWMGRAPGWANELWDCLDSTSTRAAELAASGAPAGVIILARQQTAGRGRHGRVWISPPDSGIYATFVLRPDRSRSDLPLHTLACGVAAVRAIRDTAGLNVGLKWVNDLLIGGKKVGGILAEIPGNSQVSTSSLVEGQALPLLIGVGINLHLDPLDVPEELRERVDWLENLAGQPVHPNLLVASLAGHLEQVVNLLSEGRADAILDDWRKHSVTLGCQIRAASGNRTVEGLAVDVDRAGGLIVESEDGQTTVLHAGEVTIRQQNGTYA